MAVRKAPYRWRSDAFQKPMIGDRLEMYCPPVCAEDAFMHHLAERGMGEDGVHELLLGGFELAGDDIALDQLSHFRADHMRRSEEHTSELQSLMRISSAVLCLKIKQ